MSSRTNHCFLGSSRLISAGTVESLAMYDVTPYYPGVVEEEGSFVRGEVYEVSGKTMRSLDRLEGNGYMYLREMFPVRLGDGSSVEAWVYVWRHGLTGPKVPLEAQPWRECVGCS